MKYKWYWLLGSIFGLMCFIEGNDLASTIRFSDIVQYPAFLAIDCMLDFLPQITHWYMPLLFFQIIYGIYIYRHFCSASIYFFSRNINRKKWFLTESFKLYGCTLLYLISMLITGIIVKAFYYDIIWNVEGFIILLYHICIHSLYLFAITLGTNVIAIRFGSSVGFISIMSVNIFFISLYASLGEIISEDILYTEYSWLLKINPFAHLIFKVHSSEIDSVDNIINKYGMSFDLNYSILLFGIISIAFLILGCIMCEKHEFIKNNIEE